VDETIYELVNFVVAFVKYSLEYWIQHKLH